MEMEILAHPVLHRQMMAPGSEGNRAGRVLEDDEEINKLVFNYTTGHWEPLLKCQVRITHTSFEPAMIEIFDIRELSTPEYKEEGPYRQSRPSREMSFDDFSWIICAIALIIILILAVSGN